MVTPGHCINAETKEKEPMTYLGGYDFLCKVCLLYARYCPECIHLIPEGRPGSIGIAGSVTCQHLKHKDQLSGS
jgi:hypothetical protein